MLFLASEMQQIERRVLCLCLLSQALCATQRALLFSHQPQPTALQAITRAHSPIHHDALSDHVEPLRHHEFRDGLGCARRSFDRRCCLQRQEVTAQQAPSAPVAPRRQLHLYSFRWATGAVWSQCFDNDWYLRNSQLLSRVDVQLCRAWPCKAGHLPAQQLWATHPFVLGDCL